MYKLTKDELRIIDKYFNASNYLAVAQLYLKDNPLLKRPLELSDIKSKLVGHFGTVPGQNFIYTHLNRIINKYDLNMIYISGPGHGGNAIVGHTYLEGTYSEVYPDITLDIEGLKKLFKQFSFPKGISSHVAPETPGSINEGGELGYSLSHAFGAVLDNPTLIAACVVGDGEAETGPLATSWHMNKFINPIKDGVVLPILHLNGYKIANPSILARISNSELINLFKGYGYSPIIVEGTDTYKMHNKMAQALDKCIEKINKIKKNYNGERPIWPMIILKTPKGWTGPKKVMDKKVEGSFRAHQIPLLVDKDNLDNLKVLEKWLKSYHPEEIFDDKGRILKEIKDFAPKGNKRMGANLNANGGLLLKELKLPRFEDYKLEFEGHGTIKAQDMSILGNYVRDLIKLNKNNFRIFGPDEALSNRLNSVFEETNRQFVGKTYNDDEFLSDSGRVIDSFLSEHVCEGLLEGYLLTGRHGFFHTYEAFVRIVDSMASQHAKWLKVTKELSWRKPIASLNFVLSSHIWQQDHNGYTHQDPGFLNHLVTKKSDTIRMYLPPDANTLLSCFDHIMGTKNYINVIVASKHPSFQWLNMDDAKEHCEKGIGIWKWVGNDSNNPDIVLACCGDTPTLETIAAANLLLSYYPDLSVRVVNVVDLMKLESNLKHPHGLTDFEYDEIFTKDRPIIFAFHGYASLIHQLVYNRGNSNIHVHGYMEEGTITTPFDMRVQNKLDRYNLVMDALKYLDLKDKDRLIDYCLSKLDEHNNYIKEHGIDMPDILNWTFEGSKKSI